MHIAGLSFMSFVFTVVALQIAENKMAILYHHDVTFIYHERCTEYSHTECTCSQQRKHTLARCKLHFPKAERIWFALC